MSLPKKPPRTPRHYLVYVSSGWWAIRSEENNTQAIISRSRREAQIELDKLLKPEPKTAWKPSLADELDKLYDQKEKPKEVKPAAPVKPTRSYTKNADRLQDPAILAILADVEGRSNRVYYRHGERFPLMVKLTELTGSKKISSRLIAAAWKLGLITGERIRRSTKKESPVPRAFSDRSNLQEKEQHR